MKLTRLLLPLLLLCAIPAFAMTDDQVINYIKTQSASGKSQNQIGKELLAQGVTPEQIKRIRAKYEKEQSSNSNKNSLQNQSTSRLRDRVRTEKGDENLDQFNRRTDEQTDEFEDEEVTDDLFGNNNKKKKQQDKDVNKIYGHDVFKSKSLSFEPNSNMATPQNYRLGPGDEVIIDIWGVAEDNIRQQISPDGRIMISQLGPVYLNGMTVAEANKQIKNIFAKKYAGVGSDTDISLTLGQVRSIMIDVLGEVQTPGTFRLSPFSNVFHALYSAGGINDIGSLRNIEVFRNGKRVSTIDVYDFLFKGKDTGNIRLQEGDVIIVPAYSQLVSVEGNVKRPMFYELKNNENLSKLIEYAGGFTGDAYSDVVRVMRLNGLDKELNTVNKDEYNYFTLKDGDVVTIGTVTDQFSNQVEIDGAIMRPGTYAISDNMKTVRQLINTAEGLADEAFLGRALIYREKPDRSMEVISFNLGDLMDGTIADIALNKNDMITIIDVNKITERGEITIQGLVANPGSFPYAEGLTIEDIILEAGGLLEGASTSRVEVSRRIVDPSATDVTNRLVETYTFSLENGIGVGKDKGFLLKPYDLIQIRKSPAYSAQETMTIKGQVLFPGNYVIEARNERISDVIKRAGGLLESAYIKGAFLLRKVTEEEKQRREETRRLAQSKKENQKDSISLESLDLNEDFTNIGINLQKALDSPGSSFDFVVQQDDQLVVPELQSIVKIGGDVLFPNNVVYVPGKKLGYYIDQAGGYGQTAQKNKAYVVYMNGSVAQAKRSTLIEPGCQIIVPSKPEGKAFDWTKVLTIASSLGSLASMTAAVAAILK